MVFNIKSVSQIYCDYPNFHTRHSEPPIQNDGLRCINSVTTYIFKSFSIALSWILWWDNWMDVSHPTCLWMKTMWNTLIFNICRVWMLRLWSCQGVSHCIWLQAWLAIGVQCVKNFGWLIDWLGYVLGLSTQTKHITVFIHLG